MIVPSMTKEEVQKEIREDSEWLVGRYPGICKKYKKQIKAHRQGEKILGITRYFSPRRNIIFAVWYVSGVNNKEFNLGVMHYFQYMTPAGCQYIHPTWHARELITYTSHFLLRLQEREGMTFMDFIAQFVNDSAFTIVYDTYEYKGKQVNVIPFSDKGFQIYVEDKWGKNIVTYVSKKQYKGEQLKIIDKMAEVQRQDADEFLKYSKSDRYKGTLYQ